MALANKIDRIAHLFAPPLPLLPRLIVATKDAVPFWSREVRDGEKAGTLHLAPASTLHDIFFGPDCQGGDHSPTCLNVSAGVEMALLR